MMYAIYASSSGGTTGCVNQFASVATDTNRYPPMVAHYCELCKVNHNFVLSRTVIADTPKQHERFVAYCKASSIEMDVEVS